MDFFRNWLRSRPEKNGLRISMLKRNDIFRNFEKAKLKIGLRHVKFCVK